MRLPLTSVAKSLKEAREHKGLSQRELSVRTGLPQAQISKIETGAVDPRLSSLVELARALDLELVLAPRAHLGAVRALLEGAGPAQRPAYSLDDDPGANHGD